MCASCWTLKQRQKLRAAYDLHRPTATDLLLQVRSHFFMVPQPSKSVPGWGTNSQGRQRGDISPRKRSTLGLSSELQFRLLLYKDVSAAASDSTAHSNFRYCRTQQPQIVPHTAASGTPGCLAGMGTRGLAKPRGWRSVLI